ncbi:MAG: PKD domain-containing protein, partial [Lacibacter sp.]
SFTSTYTISGAALKDLRWSKTKVPGQVSKKVVWIGSSTLAGAGASTEDSALVWRVGNYYTSMGVMSSWLNLGVSGANVFQGMPNGYVPTGSQSAPDVTHNVTYALNQGADIVIVGYPSNAYDGNSITITEIMFAYRTIFNTVVNAGKKCYIMTAQPRPAFGTTGRNLLKQVADSIMVQFPNNYIQAYYNIVQTGTHNLLYNSGDDIHLNNTGHRVLFNSVVARNVFESWATSDALIQSPNNTATSVSNLATGKHIFQVTITDTHEQSVTDTTSVTVRPEPGIAAIAGSDQNLFLPVTSTTLDGSASTGANNYLWRQLTGPITVSLTTATTAITTVTGLTAAGTYSFELSINSGASRDTVFIYAVSGSTDKVINVNIFGGSNPYNNTQWNNWNLPANRTSPVLRYADGVSSGVTLVSNISLGITDNGAGYPTTMCPPEVGRYALLSSTSSHTLTFNNLRTDGTLYNLDIYASRNNTGNTTRFTVNGRVVDINTSRNYTNIAQFTNLLPNASGQIVIIITRAAGTYAYVNGLKLSEVPNLIVSR